MIIEELVWFVHHLMAIGAMYSSGYLLGQKRFLESFFMFVASLVVTYLLYPNLF